MSVFVPPSDVLARTTMTMEADRQENTETGTDGFGSPLPPVWSTVGKMRCLIWSWNRVVALDEKRTALIEEIHGVFKRDEDISENDRIGEVRDRYGSVRFAGPLGIRTLQIRDTHKEAILRRIE